MSTLKEFYFRINFLPVLQKGDEKGKKYFYWFCIFWLLIAVLELGQDYISAVLNGNQFHVIESLSYKLFWLLFIPFSMLIAYVLEKIDSSFSGTKYFILNAFFVLVITLIHLNIFSFILFGISNFMYESSWSLPFLISEKLSTRLYIGLSVYIVFSLMFFLIKQREAMQADLYKNSKTITVKNGKNSVIVNVGEIKWISSDGPYLYIHTADKKHVILDSLKNIITTLPKNFRRIHRSTIVNIEEVTKLRSRGNGDYDIIMDSNQTLRLSRNYTKPLKGLLL